MIARVDVSPDTPASSPPPWDIESWAPILDAATSISSTIFFNTPRLRMPAQVGSVRILPDGLPPKTGYIHVQAYDSKELAVDVNVLDESGNVLGRIANMRFAEIEGTVGASGSVESLVHQVAWPPMPLTEQPLPLGQVMVVSKDQEAVAGSRKTLERRATGFRTFPSIVELTSCTPPSSNEGESQTAVILYLPDTVPAMEGVAEMSKRFCSDLLQIVKFAAKFTVPVKVFAITDDVMGGSTPTALAQAPMHGLGRIIASEQPGIWGAVIDTEESEWTLSLQAIKYAQGGDVVRISDGVVREPRLRQLPRNKMLPPDRHKQTLPRPEGTYLITGGLGVLGLEIANFLVENNARRLVLLSRRAFPARSAWSEAQGSVAEVCRAIERLESLGATVYILSEDISDRTSTQRLHQALERLALPPVLGVVHAAGVLEDQPVLESTADSFDRVLAPKVAGSLTLHQLFPVGSVDFFVMFSSCGQLFGFPGQGSYASGNAFLDTLAAHRRKNGDNCKAFQWSSWSGMGMAASTDYISAELEAKGITDITREEAFRAWEHLAKYDMEHGVVLRSRALEADEPLPASILADIAVRRTMEGSGAGPKGQQKDVGGRPKSGPELLDYVGLAVRTCVAQTLQLTTAEDVDPRSALSDLGVDSVMAVTLRTQLQKSLGVKMPPTLMWSLPTASHLQKWFAEQLKEE